MRKLWLACCCLLAGPALAMESGPSMAMTDMNDDAVYAHMLVDELEFQTGPQAPILHYDVTGSVGNDEVKLLLQSEGDRVAPDGLSARHEILADRVLGDYADLRAGVMILQNGGDHRGWGTLQLSGLAPYGIATTLAAYVTPRGALAARAQFSTDLPITNRLILTPETEWFAHRDSDFDAGIRLRYEFLREFAPYVGAVYRRETGEDSTHGWRFSLGVRLWY